MLGYGIQSKDWLGYNVLYKRVAPYKTHQNRDFLT